MTSLAAGWDSVVGGELRQRPVAMVERSEAGAASATSRDRMGLIWWGLIGALLGAVLGVSTVFAAEPGWGEGDAMIRDGTLDAPQPILEVHLAYDAKAAPVLRLKALHIKRGYAPQPEPLEHGYTLSLLSANGDILAGTPFQIPNRVFNPPPEAGEFGDGEPVILDMVEFALTVPMPEAAVELRLLDPQGMMLLTEPLGRLRMQYNEPAFDSLKPGASRHSSSWWDQLVAWWDRLMDSAEAAGSSAALDIAVVGDNYTASQLAAFHADVDRIVTHFLTYEPYKSRAGQILFHRVENVTVDLGCKHSASNSRLITCSNSTVTSVVNNAGAPADKIIIVAKDSSYGGSGGSTIAVTYNGSSAPQVAVHEFGHALGLIDEYNLYASNGSLNGTTQANCYAGAPPNPLWSGVVASTDYKKGCKYPNWYRPSPCSIMQSLNCKYFNAVSKNLLSAKLDLYAGPVAVASTAAPDAAVGAAPPLAGPADTQPPAGSIINPVSGAVLSGAVTVAVSASDDQALSRVDFFRDSALLGADNTSPYAMTWNTGSEPDGAHTLTARLVDVAGNEAGAAPVTVSVANAAGGGDAEAPSVAILKPLEGVQIKSNTWYGASASDHVKVVRMEFYLNGVLKKSTTTAKVDGYLYPTHLRPGANTVTAKAYDAAGNVGTASVTVFK